MTTPEPIILDKDCLVLAPLVVKDIFGIVKTIL